MELSTSGGGSSGTTCIEPVRSGGVGAAPPRAGTPAPSSAQLDPLETCELITGPTVVGWDEVMECNWDSVPFMHRGWHQTRRRILKTMMGLDLAESRVRRFRECGNEVHVYYQAESQEVEFHSSCCKDRWCLICGQRRSAQIARALREKMAERETRFITLTIRGGAGDFLCDQVARLRRAWRELRRHPYWKECVTGGAVMLEVKWSKGSGGHWHPHYHILCHGKWIDQDRLKAAWFAITGDSDQVCVRLVREAGEARCDVTKYASKPVDSSFVNNPKRLGEAMLALKGQRLCACFGSWYGTRLNDELEDHCEEDTLTNWTYCGTEQSLRHRRENGDAEAGTFWPNWNGSEPLDSYSLSDAAAFRLLMANSSLSKPRPNQSSTNNDADDADADADAAAADADDADDDADDDDDDDATRPPTTPTPTPTNDDDDDADDVDAYGRRRLRRLTPRRRRRRRTPDSPTLRTCDRPRGRPTTTTRSPRLTPRRYATATPPRDGRRRRDDDDDDDDADDDDADDDDDDDDDAKPPPPAPRRTTTATADPLRRAPAAVARRRRRHPCRTGRRIA